MGEVRGYCTLCRSRCGAIYAVENGKLVGARPDPQHPTGAALCSKGRAAPEIVHSARRLTRPLRRTTPKSDTNPRWREISWEEAMTEIADRLGVIRHESGPERVAFSVTSPSGTPMSDSIDWVERFIRLFGSPNTCYSTEICNWHKDFAHAFTFGTGLPTPDLGATDLAVFWGHNPAKTWLAQSAALSAARARGARVVVVDPVRSATAMQADRWLRVFPGTDAALALGLARLLIEREGHDERFVRAWTNAPLLVRTDTGRFLRAEEIDPAATGFVVWDARSGSPIVHDTAHAAAIPDSVALRGSRTVELPSGTVECAPAFDFFFSACEEWSLERTAAVTGVDATQLSELADELADAHSVCYSTWSGVGQSANATQTDRAIATLFALLGDYDAPGGNLVLPKQPANTVTWPEQLPREQQTKGLGSAVFPLGPPRQGWTTARELCKSLLNEQPYRVRALVSFGGNLLSSQPDPNRTAEALRRTEFSVHLDMFMNPTAQLADIVLPVSSPWEREAVRIGFELSLEAQETVQLRPRMVEPTGSSRSDTEFVFDLAQRLGLGAEFFGGDVEAGWNHQLAPLGITADDLRASPGGIRRPLPHRHRKYAETGADGLVTGFNTPTRRVEIYSEQLADHGQPPVPKQIDAPPDDEFPWTLTCAKNGYFCHSQHRGISSLRRRSPEPIVLLGTRIASERSISDDEIVDVSTRNGSIRMRAVVDASLHPEVAVTEHGWWEPAPDLALPGADPLKHGGYNYNLLIDDEVRDPVSGSAPMRSAACEVRVVPTSTWSGQRRFTVGAVTRESADVVSLRLHPCDGAGLPPFRPGQHITLATADDPEIARCYSLTSPADADHYSVAIRQVEGGQLSGALHGVTEGSELLVTAPAGSFTVPAHHSRPIVLIAGGIGMTPFLGYLETIAACGTTAPAIQLHHASRSPDTHLFAERLRRLSHLVPELAVVDHYSTQHGRITPQDIDSRFIQQRSLFYMCGPPPMLRDITEGLLARGVPGFDMFTEQFRAPDPQFTVPENAVARVRLARTGRDLTWRKADGTILQLAEREGIPLASGCRVGQCESCAVPVIEGTVGHLATPPDGLPPNVILTCQAVPTSDVTLDA